MLNTLLWVGTIGLALAAPSRAQPDSGHGTPPSVPPATPADPRQPEAPKTAAEGTSWTQIDAALKALSGKVGLSVSQVVVDKEKATVAGSAAVKVVHEYAGAESLNVGPGAAIYVLGATAEWTLAGKSAWTDKIPVQQGLKSIRGGQVFSEPAGTSHSLAELAHLMVADRDASAMDHIIAKVGRENIERYAARLQEKPINRPFLTSREAAAIKLGGDPTLLSRWEKADEAIRRDMLLPDDQRKPTRPAGVMHNPGEVAAIGLEGLSAVNWDKPRGVEAVGHFASATDVTRLLADLTRLASLDGQQAVRDAFAGDPTSLGLNIDRTKWKSVGFTTGGEPGVVSWAWLLTRADGQNFALSLVWNDPKSAVDSAAIKPIVQRAVELLGAEAK